MSVKLNTKAEIVAHIQSTIIEPVVGNGGVRVFDGNWKDAFEQRLGGFRTEYAQQLRQEMVAAKEACATLGLDFNALVGSLATELSKSLRVMANLPDRGLFESRLRTVPEDLVLYSWQSPKNAAALVADPAAYWPKVAKSGVYMAESPTKTSGYSGGGDFGAMVEVHIAKGTRFADVSPRAVQDELQRRHLYHNHAATPDGYTKPLNRYSDVEGWWQLPSVQEGTSFHAFDPKTKSTAELCQLLLSAASSAMPFFVAAMNEAAAARGEPLRQGLSLAAETTLHERLDQHLATWAAEDKSKGYSMESGPVCGDLIALQALGDEHPSIKTWVQQVIAGFDGTQREQLSSAASYYDEKSVGAARLRKTLGAAT